MKKSNWAFIKRLLIVIISIFPLGIVLTPAIPKTIAIIMAACLIIAILVFVFYKWLVPEGHIHRKLLLFDILLALMLVHDFYLRWIPSKMVASIANHFHISAKLFLIIISSVLGICLILTADLILWRIYTLIIRMIKREVIYYYVKRYSLIMIICILELLQLEYSSLYSLELICNHSLFIFLINVWIILLINMLIVLIVQSWKITLIITSSLFFVWGVFNYYTIQFHGSPLFLSELVNAQNAAAIVGNYRYSLSIAVVCVILMFALELYICIKCFELQEPISLGKRCIIRGGTFIVSGILLFIISRSIIINSSFELTWSNYIQRNGFAISTVRDIGNKANPVLIPDGYDVAILNDIYVEKDVDITDKPDVIIILNETFYDLNKYMDVNADVDYMSDLYNIDDSVTGYCVIPNIGGGTNNSEFELLSSKSMYLLQMSAPFMYLSNEIEQRSVVRFFDNFDYATTAMHCGGINNYSRNIAYPAMGFDNIYLGPDDFSYISNNGNRSWLDSDNYQDLIDHYETETGMENENVSKTDPQFMFLLTFQNHGGYEQNDDSLDTVHTQNDFGDLTDDINEFLSSIQLSCSAFKELTEYFAEVDRDVIICMVGDHAPSFASNLPARDDNEIDNDSINLRSVPYVIWSNFDADLSSVYTDYASMVDLVPMVLHAAGLPLSTYYQYILDLHETVPIRTSTGLYVDRDLHIGTYEPSDKYYEQMRLYYYMEYNSLLEGEEYREELFGVAK